MGTTETLGDIGTHPKILKYKNFGVRPYVSLQNSGVGPHFPVIPLWLSPQ